MHRQLILYVVFTGILSFLLVYGIQRIYFDEVDRTGESQMGRIQSRMVKENEIFGSAMASVDFAEYQADVTQTQGPQATERRITALRNILEVAPDGVDRQAYEQRTELKGQIDRLLAQFVAKDENATVGNLMSALSDLPASILRAHVWRRAGDHMGSVIHDDAELTKFCRDVFVDSTDPNVQAMMITALMSQNAWPPGYQTDAIEGLDYNLVEGLEYDMFTVALDTDDEDFRALLAYNIPKARNYDLMNEVLDLLLREPSLDRILTAADTMKVILTHEKDWKKTDLEHDRVGFEQHDISSDFGNRIVGLGGNAGLTIELVDVLIAALEAVGQTKKIHELRDNLNEKDFSPEYLARLDAVIEANWPDR